MPSPSSNSDFEGEHPCEASSASRQMSFCSETTHWRQEQEPNREDVRTRSTLMCFVLFAGSHVTSHLAVAACSPRHRSHWSRQRRAGLEHALFLPQPCVMRRFSRQVPTVRRQLRGVQLARDRDRTASSKPLSSFEEAILRIFLDFGGGADSSSKSLPSFFFLQQGLKFFARDLFRVFENDACERRVEKFDFLRTKIVHRECDREGNIPDIKLMTVFEGTSSSGWKT